jgi:predicted amidophosphoribosyltransferase
MKLTDFECPNCAANEMEATEDGHLHCLYCGSSFGEVARICPECGLYNEQGVRHCSRCGSQIIRDCPACGRNNWALAEYCVRCGRNLDLIEEMARRWQKGTQQRLYEHQAGMAALKEKEEQASQERMAALLEAERIRQEAIALAQESQRQRDQQMYVMAVVGLLVLVIIVIMFVVFMAVGG